MGRMALDRFACFPKGIAQSLLHQPRQWTARTRRAPSSRHQLDRLAVRPRDFHHLNAIQCRPRETGETKRKRRLVIAAARADGDPVSRSRVTNRTTPKRNSTSRDTSLVCGVAEIATASTFCYLGSSFFCFALFCSSIALEVVICFLRFHKYGTWVLHMDL